MPSYSVQTPIAASPKDLFDWHSRPGAFERLIPPWRQIEVKKRGSLTEGGRAHLRVGKGPLKFQWIAELRDVEPGKGFVDEQISGPFARWIHRHEFRNSSTTSLLCDRIDYRLPGGDIGQALAGRQIRRDLETTFAFRHSTTVRDFERHKAFAHEPRITVGITGSTGLLGRNLGPFLTSGGHRVVRLKRSKSEAPDTSQWSPHSGSSPIAVDSPLDAVIHLAGESIAEGRWTQKRKERIRKSRIEGTRNLISSLAKMENPPKTFICASAIGYYGARGSEQLDESNSSGRGFLAEVCREWEEAAQQAASLGMRVVMLRLGVVLTPAGGALAKMLPPFKVGIGGRLGNGMQYMSWVSIDDVIGAINHILFTRELTGPVNVVAPEPCTNQEFTETLGRVLRRPTLCPLSRFALRTLFGELADEMLLASTRASPTSLQKSGFSFFDSDLEHFLARLLGKERSV